MGGFFAGLAGSIGDHLHEQHLLNLQNQIESKRNLLDNYKVLLQDPHMVDVHGDIVQSLLKAAGTDPAKLHKQIGKPGGEFDPTQWQVLAQQRASGQQPSPVNQGQNPTQIPAAPVQHDGTPGGQEQSAPAWNDAASSMGGGSGAGQPPPPPSQSQPQPPQMSAPPPPVAQMAGSSAAQSIQALPPTQGGAGAPDAATVVGPQQAGAMTPPPPPSSPTAPGQPSFQYGPMGSLPQSELVRRQLSFEQQKAEGSQQAQMHRMTAEAAFNTEQDKVKINNHIDTLKKLGVWQTLNPREKAAVATGIQTLGNTPRQLAIPGNVPGSSAQQGQTDINGHEVDPSGVYHLRPNPATGEVDWIPQAIKKTLQWAADEDDPQKLKLYEVNPFNPQDKTAVKDISKFNPSMIPAVKNATQWKQVTQPDGSIALVPVSVTSTSQKTPTTQTSSGAGTGAGPTASKGSLRTSTPPPPPAGGPAALPHGSMIVGGKALTPEQIITNEQKMGALDNTADLVKSVQKSMPLLGSLIDAGKIQMQIDPNQGIFKAFINRNVPLSPEEARLAGDFASLMEHINTLRGPLGATGFRGEEAFSALQAQRGQLMANPAVTSQVLANTLKALNRTRQPIADGLKRAGKNPDQQNQQNITPPPGGGDDNKVIVVAPDGKAGRIPRARLQDYLDHGYKQQ